ncbi:vomeronasal type-2 receptor 26-like [Engystomops pustulosus]|uniref:vomeronasal type-2 receptor 26-like n=1 Tax=Engystomops pustulosus TaxID=76066 RepID=UPI003AFB2A8E
MLLDAETPGLLLIVGYITLYFSSLSSALKALLCVLFLCVTPCIFTPRTSAAACNLQTWKIFEDYEYVLDGDIMIGGVVSVNSYVTEMGHMQMSCLFPCIYYYKNLLAFFYAVDEINRNPLILPNLTLGYHIYDSCTDPRKAIKSILLILSGPGYLVPNYSCTRKKKVVGFIGDHFSSTTLPIAQLLGIYPYTQISYGATDTFLSDRNLFPSFFRTVPDDYTTYFIISHFLSSFGWTWVGIIASDDDDGDRDTRLLTDLLTSHGICVAFVLKAELQRYLEENYRDESSEVIKKSSARVIVICGIFSILMETFLEHVQHVIHDRILIVNPTFSPHIVNINGYHKIFNLSLLFYFHQEQITGMENYITSFHPSKYPTDMILEDLWIVMFRCSSGKIAKDQLFSQILNISLINCNGTERLDDFHMFLSQGNTFQMYEAVQSLSVALHHMFHAHQSIDQQIYQPANKIPRSQCSTSCVPGERKVMTNSIHRCCYDCAPCSAGEISIAIDSEYCMKCPEDTWPNENRTSCIFRKMEYLSYTEDVISIFLNCFTFFFFIITILTLSMFIFNRDTPIVRANNKNLSFVLLVSIMLSFLCVFLFLGRPVDITCMLRQISTGIFLSVSISSLLAKTIMVYIAFKATRPGSVWRTWTGVRLPNCVLLICPSVQVVLCMSWVTLSPPFQELDTHSYKEKVVVQCNEGSDLWFYSVLGYMGVLAAVSFITAFLARTLPDSFNEAKYITFSMLVFCSVWIAMIPAYLSTRGKYMVAVEIFAILTSSAGLLGCIFLPKCYIIFCRPELNTKSYVLSSRSA